MKVTATDNLADAFKATSTQVGELRVPVIGLKMGLPIGFEAEIKEDIDAVNEEQLLADAQAEIDMLITKLIGEVKTALNEALKAGVWAWNGGARDIYDTGELARSVSVQASSDGILVSYSAPYANIVHNGGYIHPYGNMSARPIYLPPRPWVTAVLYGGGPIAPFDFDAFFRNNMG